jgi:hypothetical protein
MELRGAFADAYDSLKFRIAVVRPRRQKVKVTLADGRQIRFDRRQ